MPDYPTPTFADAVQQEPIQYDPAQGLLANAGSYGNRLMSRHGRLQQEATATDNLAAADDPNYRSDRMLAYLRKGNPEPAGDRVIDRLIAAKKESDRRNYSGKTAIIHQLMQERPDEFLMDSQQGTLIGWTHVPTGFRFHLPRT